MKVKRDYLSMIKNEFIIIVLLSLCFYVCGNDEDALSPPSYSTPLPSGDVHIAEPFDSDDALESWTPSKATKDGVDSDIAKYNGKWLIQPSIENALPRDTGLLLKEKAKHHAIAASLDRPFVFDGASFIMQYEVNFQSGLECGGAYVKLLTQTEDMNLETVHDKTPYTIMFGPDKCGEDYKLHFIFRHKNPKTGEFEEKHAKKPTTDFKSYFNDKSSHLYTLVVMPDNSFTISIDQTVINSGNLLEDFSPPVNPPKEIVDKEDKKPEDWDEREKIADPSASKPEDWDESAPKKITDPDAEMPDDWLEDEPLYIDDPESSRPEDWDDEMDGEWEAPKVDNPKCKEVSGCGSWEPPMIDNPAFKGKWVAPQITNPNYKGIWKPRMIPNPDYFEDTEPYKMTSIGGVGFELWSMSENILFDNILITSDRSVADDYAEKTWKIKKTFRARNEKRNATRSKKKQKEKKKKNKAKSKGREGKSRSSLKIKPGFLTGLAKTMEEKPWLWVVVVLVFGLPLVLIYSFCCGGKKKEEDSKKTDEPTPEDPHESEEESKDGAKEDDNEEPAAEESQNEEEETGGAAGDGKPSVTKADLEVDDGDVIDALDDDNKIVKQSPRKRRVRKQE